MRADDFEPDDDDADAVDAGNDGGQRGTGADDKKPAAPVLTADEAAAVAEMRSSGIPIREALYRAKQHSAQERIQAQRTTQRAAPAEPAGNPDDVITRGEAERMAQQHAARATAAGVQAVKNETLQDSLRGTLQGICRDGKTGYGKACTAVKMRVIEELVGERLGAEQQSANRTYSNAEYHDRVRVLTKEVIAEDLAASGVKRGAAAQDEELNARLAAQPRATGAAGTNTTGTSWPTSEECDNLDQFIADKGRAPTKAELDRAFDEELRKFDASLRG